MCAIRGLQERVGENYPHTHIKFPINQCVHWKCFKNGDFVILKEILSILIWLKQKRLKTDLKNLEICGSNPKIKTIVLLVVANILFAVFLNCFNLS